MNSRQEFLLRFYENAWKNMAQARSLLWQFFLAYATVVLGGALLAENAFSSLPEGLFGVLAITAVATCHAFSQHTWFLRNLILVSNVEACFLDDDDYGTIIPTKWRPPFEGTFFSPKELTLVLGLIYPAFGLSIFFIYFERLDACHRAKLAIVALFFAVLVVVWVASQRSRFEEWKEDAPGPPTNPQ